MSGTLKVGGKTLATHDTNTNVAKIQLGSTSDVVLTDSAGNNVLSESGGVVTLTADEANVGSNALVVDSSGNVGVGTSSPNSIGTGVPTIDLKGNNATQSDRSGGLYFTRYDGTGSMFIAHTDGSNVIGGLSTYPTVFKTNNTEAMRIDSSGHVLVGTNSLTVAGLASAGNGVRFSPSGIVSQFASNGISAAAFNRTSNNGSIVEFRKDGTTVGSIGSVSGAYVYMGNVGGVGLLFVGSNIRPSTDGANADNVYDLGVATVRWDDIYATNGTIQTSDRNEKQDIEELTEAEQRVAVAAKALMRKFRWKSAVVKKGDEARIHFGIIAQDLQAAFEAEGLDVGRYAMFISSTWWETSETYTDDEGIEQTRINTYDTAEEAPEGAVERTRLGIRYSELLAFIIAAI